MLKRLSLIIALLGSLLPSLAWADGMIVADPSVYYDLVEDQQIAVIEVDKNRTVRMDLFVSLIDTSGRSNKITFILPFYAKPSTFEVREKKYEDFTLQRVEELDGAIGWKRDFKGRVDLSALIAGRLLGLYLPGELYLPWLTMAGVTSTITPERVVVTEHSETRIYRVGSEEELEEILREFSLSDELKNKLRLYERDYLYITTIDTIPYKQDEYGKIDSLGLHFSSALRLTADDATFSYPLSTGQTWGNPISLTRVYVTSPYGVGLKVKFPIFGQKISDEKMARDYSFGTHYYLRQREEYTQKGETEKLKELTKPYCSMDQVNTGEFKVYRATYIFSNPDEDIEITPFVTRLDFLPLIFWAIPLEILGSSLFLIFILLGTTIWILLFRFIVGGSFKGIYSFKNKRLYLDSLCCLIICRILSFLGYEGGPIAVILIPSITIALVAGLWILLFKLVVNPVLKLDSSAEGKNLYRHLLCLGILFFLITFAILDYLTRGLYLTALLIIIFGIASWLHLFGLVIKKYKRVEWHPKRASLYINGLWIGLLCSLASWGSLLILYSGDCLWGWIPELIDSILFDLINKPVSDTIYKIFAPDLSSYGAALPTIPMASTILLLPLGALLGAVILKRGRKLAKLPFWPIMAVVVLAMVFFNLLGFGLATLLKCLV